MRRPVIATKFLIVLLAMLRAVTAAPLTSKHSSPNLNKYFLEAMSAFKRLEKVLPRKDLQQLTTLGILSGVQKVEDDMEKDLIVAVKDLLLSTNMNESERVLPKIAAIEEQLIRDEQALRILANTMDLATKNKTLVVFKREMQKLLEEVKDQPKSHIMSNITNTEEEQEKVALKIGELRQHILRQMELMKIMVDDKIHDAVDYLIQHADRKSLLGKASDKVIHKRQAHKEEPVEVRQIKSILTEDDFRKNLVDEDLQRENDDNAADELELFDFEENSKKITQRSSKETTKLAPPSKKVESSAKQDEASPELDSADMNGTPAADGGGVLTGLIASLSGGEGGSDVGALIGALTGVISNLFGPGGLDIVSLISTGTSLISGLLAGNKNFGTVLGVYVGTAFDGLSGGGGAINNGQFIGNFLGTLIASLSADPEEDNVPPRPLIFLQNFVNSFIEAKNRKDSDEDTENIETTTMTSKGSDSGAFIKHIAAHIVGGAVSLVLNAVLGASAGASNASSALFSGSSARHKPAADG